MQINRVLYRRDGRAAEGAPLLREYGFYSPSRVRIPLSPPLFMTQHSQCKSETKDLFAVWNREGSNPIRGFDQIARNLEHRKNDDGPEGVSEANNPSLSAIIVLESIIYRYCLTKQ